MNKKLLIGIPGWKLDGGFGVSIAYLQWIEQFGQPRIILPWEGFIPEIDLLILPGGLDIRPDTFGEYPGFATSNTDVFKQHFFDNRLQTYIESGVKIVGICLGMQQLVAYFGGTLCQDLPDHPYYSSPRTELCHEAIMFENGKAIANKSGHPLKIRINSLHHQGAYENKLPADLKMILGIKTGNTYLVEALKHKDLPILGFQYHPKHFGAC